MLLMICGRKKGCFWNSSNWIWENFDIPNTSQVIEVLWKFYFHFIFILFLLFLFFFKFVLWKLE